MEKAVLKAARGTPYYENLLTLPGVGKILGMTITMEVGEIGRFAGPEHFASYCRTVNAKRLRNGKGKGENNAKCGNKYLSWALVEPPIGNMKFLQLSDRPLHQQQEGARGLWHRRGWPTHSGAA
jgi:transposase